jgi:hypothetical protein
MRRRHAAKPVSLSNPPWTRNLDRRKTCIHVSLTQGKQVPLLLACVQNARRNMLYVCMCKHAGSTHQGLERRGVRRQQICEAPAVRPQPQPGLGAAAAGELVPGLGCIERGHDRLLRRRQLGPDLARHCLPPLRRLPRPSEPTRPYPYPSLRRGRKQTT